MAIRINLYHEVQKARQLKRRDPLKLSMYSLSAIGACFAIYYGVELGRMHAIGSELARAQEEFNQIDPKAKAAKLREDEMSEEIRKSELVTRRMEERFYWAPMLEQIAQTVPREVQVTRLVGEVSGDSVHKCSIVLDGLSAGSDPRKVAEELRTALAEKLGPSYKGVTSTFKSLEDGTELVMLDGKQIATASFAINLQFTTGEEAIAPTVRKKR